MTIEGLRRQQILAPKSEECDEATPQQTAPASSAAARPPLRVLLVAYAFPPTNAIGAVRVGKFAKYLHEAGHHVRVVTGPAEDGSLALEIPPEQVTSVAGWRIDEVLDGMVGLLRRPRPADGGGRAMTASDGAIPPRRALFATLTRHYRALLHIPDVHAGWISAATAAGRAIIRDWRPDVVVGSAPPNSGLVAAARIARACGSPWVSELRDLWVDNSYYHEPGWRLWLDRLLEWRTLSSAAGLVSVTPRWTDALRRRYRQPIACIFNGYVEEDFPPDPLGPPRDGVVRILYAGSLYAGYRDPTPLFRAIGLLGAERDRVAVDFYGPSPEELTPLAAAHDVLDRVFIHEPVSYRTSLALQTAADALLLLQWNNEKDAGNIPAKFYEYLGARRPILLLGYPDGDLAAMIRERRAGVVANDPAAIARQLRQWIAAKPAGIPPVDAKARIGMTREEQFRDYERFLTRILTAK